nr:MAG TPA: hypothetical protein [Bacteriophage sp.]
MSPIFIRIILRRKNYKILVFLVFTWIILHILLYFVTIIARGTSITKVRIIIFTSMNLFLRLRSRLTIQVVICTINLHFYSFPFSRTI